MFTKSIKLHKTDEAQGYLSLSIEKQKLSQTRKAKPAPETPKAPKYSHNQDEICLSILKKKNYYDILGVSSTHSNGEIKKAYKRLALKLHPDKNQAPSATDAFKLVNKAFSCLNDDQKRRNYDLLGSDETLNLPASNFQNSDEVFRDIFGNTYSYQQTSKRYKPPKPTAPPLPRTSKKK